MGGCIPLQGLLNPASGAVPAAEERGTVPEHYRGSRSLQATCHPRSVASAGGEVGPGFGLDYNIHQLCCFLARAEKIPAGACGLLPDFGSAVCERFGHKARNSTEEEG